MRSLRVVWKRIALGRAQRNASWLHRLTGAFLLALLLGLAVGVGAARAAASPAFVGGGSLGIVQPNYRGIVGGPPGTRVVVQGSSWMPYGTITLSITSSRSSCGSITVGDFGVDQNGAFTAGFLWPSEANQLGVYYVCGSQAGVGAALSGDAFTVLASNPASLTFSPSSVVAGDTVTVTGSNWVPGPQTMSLVIVACAAICDTTPVAQATLVTGADGTFTQQMTISAGAPSGEHYVQAANALATLSAVSAGHIEVTGQATASGTPVTGVNPTTTATRTTQGGAPGSSTTTQSPLSQAKSSLQNALLAAGLGLVVLLGLIGAGAFFIGRSHGPEVRARAGKESELAKGHPDTSRRAPWRTANPAGAALPAPSSRALTVAQHYQRQAEPEDEEALAAPDEELPTSPENEDDYPWDERIPPPPELTMPDPGEEDAPAPRRSRRSRQPGDRWER